MMQANDLTRDQARALKNKLHPMLDYLGRLNKRIAGRGFPDDDPLKSRSSRRFECCAPTVY